MSGVEKKQIVILGGGFAGLYAALEFEKKLARDPDIEVTSVSKRPEKLSETAARAFLEVGRVWAADAELGFAAEPLPLPVSEFD